MADINTKDDFADMRSDASASAKGKAKAKLRNQNKNEWTCDLTVMANLKLTEGMTFTVEGYGVYDGTYIADTVSHTLDGSSGFETSINGHRVLKGY